MDLLLRMNELNSFKFKNVEVPLVSQPSKKDKSPSLKKSNGFPRARETTPEKINRFENPKFLDRTPMPRGDRITKVWDNNRSERPQRYEYPTEFRRRKSPTIRYEEPKNKWLGSPSHRKRHAAKSPSYESGYKDSKQTWSYPVHHEVKQAKRFIPSDDSASPEPNRSTKRRKSLSPRRMSVSLRKKRAVKSPSSELGYKDSKKTRGCTLDQQVKRAKRFLASEDSTTPEEPVRRQKHKKQHRHSDRKHCQKKSKGKDKKKKRSKASSPQLHHCEKDDETPPSICFSPVIVTGQSGFSPVILNKEMSPMKPGSQPDLDTISLHAKSPEEEAFCAALLEPMEDRSYEGCNQMTTTMNTPADDLRIKLDQKKMGNQSDLPYDEMLSYEVHRVHYHRNVQHVKNMRLVAKNLPSHLCHMKGLCDFFSMFGSIRLLNLCFEDDPQSAFVQYFDYEGANQAYRRCPQLEPQINLCWFESQGLPQHYDQQPHYFGGHDDGYYGPPPPPHKFGWKQFKYHSRFKYRKPAVDPADTDAESQKQTALSMALVNRELLERKIFQCEDSEKATYMKNALKGVNKRIEELSKSK